MATLDSVTEDVRVRQAIAYAVEHSREYQAQMETLYLTALDVTLKETPVEMEEVVVTARRPVVELGALVDGDRAAVARVEHAEPGVVAGQQVEPQPPGGHRVPAVPLLEHRHEQRLLRREVAIHGAVADTESI